MCVFLVLDIFRIHKQIMYAIRVEKNASIRKRLFFFVSVSLAETSKWIDSPVMSRTCVCLCSYIISSFFLLSKLPLSCIIFHLMIIIYKDRFILCFRFIFLIFFLSLFYREHLWLSLLRLTYIHCRFYHPSVSVLKWILLNGNFYFLFHIICFVFSEWRLTSLKKNVKLELLVIVGWQLGVRFKTGWMPFFLSLSYKIVLISINEKSKKIIKNQEISDWNDSSVLLSSVLQLQFKWVEIKWVDMIFIRWIQLKWLKWFRFGLALAHTLNPTAFVWENIHTASHRHDMA